MITVTSWNAIMGTLSKKNHALVTMTTSKGMPTDRARMPMASSAAAAG